MDRSRGLRRLGYLLVATPATRDDVSRLVLSLELRRLLEELKPLTEQENLLIAAYKEIAKTELELDKANLKIKELTAELNEIKLLGTAEKPLHEPQPPLESVNIPLDETLPSNNLGRLAWSIAHRKSDHGRSELAYLMSCFSELSYLHISRAELDKGRGRYKLFNPSIAANHLIKMGVSINIEIMLRDADIPVEVVERENFIYLIFGLGQTAVIAVRGTVISSARDWLIDVDARPRRVPGGAFHRGFYDEARSALENDLRPKLQHYRSIRFTGHSLGAAVAGILSQLWAKPEAVETPYLFACPRYGSRPVVEEKRRIGYRRPADPVPHLPPAMWGYSHHGLEDNVLRKRGVIRFLKSALQALPLGFPHHSIEGIRKHLGDMLGDEYPTTAYVDAIKKEML